MVTATCTLTSAPVFPSAFGKPVSASVISKPRTLVVGDCVGVAVGTVGGVATAAGVGVAVGTVGSVASGAEVGVAVGTVGSVASGV